LLRVEEGGIMNKTDLAKAIAGKAKLKLSDTEKLVNGFIETVSDELKKKGKVTLPGFGTFTVAHRKQKTGVNPKTGAKITIKGKDVPKFKAGKVLCRHIWPQ
jgi:DNA-binding protein HU-beta